MFLGRVTNQFQDFLRILLRNYPDIRFSRLTHIGKVTIFPYLNRVYFTCYFKQANVPGFSLIPWTRLTENVLVIQKCNIKYIILLRAIPFSTVQKYYLMLS